jgi:uncharacterized protein
MSAEPRTVVVSGSSGLIGSALVTQLAAAGHHVKRLVRRPALTGEIRWDPAAGELPAADLEGVDAVIHLAGAGIGDKRWTAVRKQEILESRTKSTDLLARTLAALDQPPAVLLSGSAIGIYGARSDEELDEKAETGTGFLADLCRAWEAATEPATAAGISVAHLRSGLVLSPAGGALARQVPLFKFGLGGRFGSGRQWQSWISIDDEVGAIEHLLTASVTGPVNLTAPEPVTNSEFTDVLAGVLRRPHLPLIPSIGPKVLFGSELVENVLLTGQRVIPAVLTKSGYVFRHPNLEGALRHLLGR